MKFCITWTETVGYSAIVDADSIDDARNMLHEGEVDGQSMQEEWAETDATSIEVSECCQECEGTDGEHYLNCSTFAAGRKPIRNSDGKIVGWGPQ